jgi:hypothetical protein
LSSSRVSEGALLHVQAIGRNTGWLPTSVEDWAARKQDRERLTADTERLAAILEAQGVQARLPVEMTALGACTGEMDFLDGWRNTNVLPLVASRNRGQLLRDLQYFVQTHPKSKYLRYAVVTSGERVPLFGDLRGRMQDLHRLVSRWANDVCKRFDIEVYHRQTEAPADIGLTFHIHANVFFLPTRMLKPAELAAFNTATQAFFGSWWKDCGRLENVNEVVKYCLKGDDLALLCDLACAVPEWADDELVVEDVAERVAGRLASAHNAKHHTKWAAAGFMESALSQVQAAAQQMQAHARAGQPHPLVWLMAQMHRLHIGQTMGALAEKRRDLRMLGMKIANVKGDDGSRLRPVMKKRKRDPEDEPDRRRAVWRLGEDETGKLVFRKEWLGGVEEKSFNAGPVENQICAVTLPQRRFSAYAEPLIMVRNYTSAPTTAMGRAGLSRIKELEVIAGEHWAASGAPVPSQAVQQSRRAMVALGEDAKPLTPGRREPEDAGAAQPPLDRPHLYDNCGEETGFDADLILLADGTQFDGVTGEVMSLPPPLDECWDIPF